MALEYFIVYYPFPTAAVILTYLVLWYLRCRFRGKINDISEETCDTLRP